MSCVPSKVGDTPTLETTLVKVSDSLALNISSATTKRIYLTDPNNVSTAYPAAFVTDGTDGKLSITLAAGTLNAPGIWRYQGFVILSGGAQFSGDESTFEVQASRYGDTL